MAPGVGGVYKNLKAKQVHRPTDIQSCVHTCAQRQSQGNTGFVCANRNTGIAGFFLVSQQKNPCVFTHTCIFLGKARRKDNDVILS